jgi:hypothetical protein
MSKRSTNTASMDTTAVTQFGEHPLLLGVIVAQAKACASSRSSFSSR